MDMQSGKIDYPRIRREQAEATMRRILSQVAQDGMPGKHRFLIKFNTRMSGVHMPKWLRMKHPKTMTILVHEKFWDLNVTQHDFSVSLLFGSDKHSMVIPYAAVLHFSDPSARYHLDMGKVTDEDVSQNVQTVDFSKKIEKSLVDGKPNIIHVEFRRKSLPERQILEG